MADFDMGGLDQTMTYLNQHLGAGKRSDVLKPLAWLVGIMLAGAIGLQHVGAPGWSIAALLGLLGIIIVMYVGSYIYCLLYDRDALRSERYAIEKLAIEKGVYGDDRSGMVDITPKTRTSNVVEDNSERVSVEDGRSDQ